MANSKSFSSFNPKQAKPIWSEWVFEDKPTFSNGVKSIFVPKQLPKYDYLINSHEKKNWLKKKRAAELLESTSNKFLPCIFLFLKNSVLIFQ